MGDTDISDLPKFLGYICEVQGHRGIAFVEKESIIHVSGPNFDLPNEDLMLHINENRGLPDPLPKRRWITFFVRHGGRTRSGIEVFGAQIDDQYQRASQKGRRLIIID